MAQKRAFQKIDFIHKKCFILLTSALFFKGESMYYSVMELVADAAEDVGFSSIFCRFVRSANTSFRRVIKTLHTANAKRTQKLLHRLAEQGDWLTCINVTETAYTAPKTLAFLAWHQDMYVRRMAVLHQKCPREHAVWALQDKEEKVRNAAKERLKSSR